MPCHLSLHYHILWQIRRVDLSRLVNKITGGSQRELTILPLPGTLTDANPGGDHSLGAEVCLQRLDIMNLTDSCEACMPGESGFVSDRENLS